MATMTVERSGDMGSSCSWPNHSAYTTWDRHLVAPGMRCFCTCHDRGEPWCQPCADRHMETVSAD
jgi:hypothetical protein